MLLVPAGQQGALTATRCRPGDFDAEKSEQSVSADPADTQRSAARRPRMPQPGREEMCPPAGTHPDAGGEPTHSIRQKRQTTNKQPTVFGRIARSCQCSGSRPPAAPPGAFPLAGWLLLLGRLPAARRCCHRLCCFCCCRRLCSSARLCIGQGCGLHGSVQVLNTCRTGGGLRGCRGSTCCCQSCPCWPCCCGLSSCRALRRCRTDAACLRCLRLLRLPRRWRWRRRRRGRQRAPAGHGERGQWGLQARSG